MTEHRERFLLILRVPARRFFPARQFFTRRFAKWMMSPCFQDFGCAFLPEHRSPGGGARKFFEKFKQPIHSFYGASECGGICYDRKAQRLKTV